MRQFEEFEAAVANDCKRNGFIGSKWLEVIRTNAEILREKLSLSFFLQKSIEKVFNKNNEIQRPVSRRFATAHLAFDLKL